MWDQHAPSSARGAQGTHPPDQQISVVQTEKQLTPFIWETAELNLFKMLLNTESKQSIIKHFPPLLTFY